MLVTSKVSGQDWREYEKSPFPSYEDIVEHLQAIARAWSSNGSTLSRENKEFTSIIKDSLITAYNHSRKFQERLYRQNP
jgi:uncharacterized damage-inducible protein DinB